MNEITQKFSIQSYIDKNRDRIDESLVSLRIMREVDKFLDYEKLTNKDLATRLGYSESYISQLMSGVKNVNIPFVNNFEKFFSAKFDFKIYLKNEEQFLNKLDKREEFKININITINLKSDENPKFSFIQDNKSMFFVKDIEHETL